MLSRECFKWRERRAGRHQDQPGRLRRSRHGRGRGQGPRGLGADGGGRAWGLRRDFGAGPRSAPATTFASVRQTFFFSRPALGRFDPGFMAPGNLEKILGISKILICLLGGLHLQYLQSFDKTYIYFGPHKMLRSIFVDLKNKNSFYLLRFQMWFLN
jgi:hypothetical protein